LIRAIARSTTIPLQHIQQMYSSRDVPHHHRRTKPKAEREQKSVLALQPTDRSDPGREAAEARPGRADQTIKRTHSSHVCGTRHLHLPPATSAWNGMAGSPPRTEDSGQELGGHGSVAKSRLPQQILSSPL
jgi:hypothetical protein